MPQAEGIAGAEALQQDQYWYAQGAALRPLNIARSRKGKGKHAGTEVRLIGGSLNPENTPGQTCSPVREVVAAGGPLLDG